MAKTITIPANPNKSDTLTLPDGKLLTYGDEFTINNGIERGRYSFRYGWTPPRTAEELWPHQVTCFGPVGSKDPRTRTFYARHVTRVHRKKIERTE